MNTWVIPPRTCFLDAPHFRVFIARCRLHRILTISLFSRGAPVSSFARPQKDAVTHVTAEVNTAAQIKITVFRSMLFTGLNVRDLGYQQSSDIPAWMILYIGNKSKRCHYSWNLAIAWWKVSLQGDYTDNRQDLPSWLNDRKAVVEQYGVWVIGADSEHFLFKYIYHLSRIPRPCAPGNTIRKIFLKVSGMMFH